MLKITNMAAALNFEVISKHFEIRETVVMTVMHRN
jgi:hypothetical protein